MGKGRNLKIKKSLTMLNKSLVTNKSKKKKSLTFKTKLIRLYSLVMLTRLLYNL
jgi:hypothetical protein